MGEFENILSIISGTYIFCNNYCDFRRVKIRKSRMEMLRNNRWRLESFRRIECPKIWKKPWRYFGKYCAGLGEKVLENLIQVVREY